MQTLIVKLNATGDVVRTTPLLDRLEGDVTWVTAAKNVLLLDGLGPSLRCFSWEQRNAALDRRYDLVISLEDELKTAAFVQSAQGDRIFGAQLNGRGEVGYTEDSRRWFDLSLISVYGRQRADELKFLNRRTYQELIFEGLGFEFQREPYLLPEPAKTDLSGDVAIAPVAGPVWPMKSWAWYDELQARLEGEGLTVNMLPSRPTLLEHLGDVAQHRVLVGGDSLPMHFALGVGIRCVSIFNCTSPWEIYDYGLQTKLISPLLGEFFYQRGMDPRATRAISLDSVYTATVEQLNLMASASAR
jgi:ADP-heptose:LPS heptosyltransferase